jgi:hypothetical protein
MPRTEENAASNPFQITILHQTKSKYKQVASSLMLTSSLMSHKQKINKLRQERHDQLPFHSPSTLLTANRLTIDRRQHEDVSEKDYSNIQELKHLARKLEQENIVKLGKENETSEYCES